MDKRKKVEQYVIGLMKVFDENDEDKPNVTRYTKMFGSMTDIQFKKWITNIKDGVEQLYIYAPNLKNKIDAEIANKACKYTGTLIEEKLWFPDEISGRKYKSPDKYLVLPVPIRRLQQFLMHKISVPESDIKRDLLSGQVVKPDKGSSMSLVEMQSVVDKGLETSVIELIKVRGGDIHAYSEAVAAIYNKGEVSLAEVDMGSSVPRSAATVSTFLKGMHIDNNFVQGDQL